ncbi:Lyase [Ancylostoma duodenale]|uniref:Lyase n=1 Tax=Ancylostoma duodenale TaxID=51022 RepID=A0A0C2CBV9_9BILA|nr:Lyase [Ancylostoma duodenale]
MISISMMAACPEDRYESVLASRYCKRSPLIEILSERNKTILWRQLWIWLAESELELGLKQVTPEAIKEMKEMRDSIDWQKIRDEERRLKHDVMAHNHAFGAICPKAAGIIHLGATSCFVQDNADLIVIRDSVRHLLRRAATVLDRMATFAERERSHVTVGRTHYQTASLVTVGKRAALWAQELLMAFKQLEHFHDTMKFRGIKGATGTQDSFLTLFGGDEEMLPSQHRSFNVINEIFKDVHLIFALATIGSAVKKICTDIRDQIGSSAMPYKKNPMKSERCCSLARKLIHMPQEALSILSDQGLERTLDDSAGRRMLLPDSLLTTEAMLTTLQNVFEGLTVQDENVARVVREELPFLGLEKAMMWLTEEGVDRQQVSTYS